MECGICIYIYLYVLFNTIAGILYTSHLLSFFHFRVAASREKHIIFTIQFFFLLSFGVSQFNFVFYFTFLFSFVFAICELFALHSLFKIIIIKKKKQIKIFFSALTFTYACIMYINVYICIFMGNEKKKRKKRRKNNEKEKAVASMRILKLRPKVRSR